MTTRRTRRGRATTAAALLSGVMIASLDESDPQARAEGCLVGTWTLDNEAWGAEVMSLPEFAGGTATFSGEMVLD